MDSHRCSGSGVGFFEELEPRLLLASTLQGLALLSNYEPAAASAHALRLRDLIPSDILQNHPDQVRGIKQLLKSITKTGSTSQTYDLLGDVSGDYTTDLIQADPLISLDDYRADSRFTGVDGSGFSTVIIDTGIDLNHPFFGPDADSNGVADRIVYSYDFSGSNDPDASDTQGHGTNVASIIASQDATYTGVAPGVSIIALKVFPDGSTSASDADIEEALQWVVANAATYNIASVNMSLGSGNYSSPVTSSWSDEMAALAAMNVMVVCASGNSYYQYQTQGVAYPSADPSAFSVGAVWDSSGGQVSWSGGAIDYSYAPNRIVSFSQRSATMTDVFAPGAWITGANYNGGLVTMSGTSQATPFVTGMAVLAQDLAQQELGRRLTPAEFKTVLVNGGITINDGDDENDNVTNTGLNFRRVDAEGMASSIWDMTHSIVIDNTAGSGVTVTGSWQTATTASFPYSTNYLHDKNTLKGSKSVRFTPTIPTTGAYDVLVWFPYGGGFATNVPVDVVSASGTTTVTLDESTGGGQWVSLGTYNFNAGTSGSVLIRTTGTTNYVVADAVKFTAVAHPTAVDDAYDATKDVVLTVSAGQGVLANDVATPGHSLTAIKVTDPAHGALTLNADGSFTYTPVTGYVGSDAFTYKANDGVSDSNVATVTLTVNSTAVPVEVILDNTASSGVAITGVWTASTSTPGYYGLNYLHDGYAGAGKSVRFTPTLTAAGDYEVFMWYTAGTNRATNVPVDVVYGGVTTTVTVNETINGGQWVSLGTYHFAAGSAGYVTIRDDHANGYVVADAVKFTPVASGNTAPVAADDSYAVNENATLTVSAAQGVLANDTDANNDPLTAIKVTDPAHGALTLNADGSFTYTPVTGYVGSDAFTYKANDGVSDSNVATVTLTVNSTAVPVEVILDNTASSGVAITGVWTASTSTPGYYGLNYLHDGYAGAGKSVRFTPTLTAAGDYEVFMWYTAGTNRATNVPVDVVYGGVTTTVTVNETINGGQWVSLGTYHFAAGSAGYVTIRDDHANGYVVADAVKFTPVASGNTAPVAADDSYAVNENATLTVSAGQGVLANDVATPGHSLTAIKVTDPAHGALTLNADGSFTYTPVTGYVGSDAFTYKANDGVSDSNVATVTLTVNSTAVPVEVILDNTASSGVAITGVWTASTSTPGYYGLNYLHDGYAGAGKSVRFTPTLTAAGDYEVFMWYTAGTNRATNVPVDVVYGGVTTTVTVNETINGGQWVSLGTYHFAAGSAGYVTIRDDHANGYVVADAVKFTPVASGNTAPVAADDSYAVNENATLTVSAAQGVLANDTDANNDPLTAIKVTDPAHGALTLNADGSFTYTPVTGYVGSDAFTYKANDGVSDSNVATVTLTVNSTAVPVEVILDNTASSGVAITGVWTASTSTPGYYGLNYLHDGYAGAGKSVRFTPTLTAAGDYEVFMWYTAGTNRATNVPVDVVYGGVTTTVTVNETINGGQWVSLGTYHFAAGTAGYVTIRDDHANGYVVADAVKFTPVASGASTEPITAEQAVTQPLFITQGVTATGSLISADSDSFVATLPADLRSE